MFVIKMYCRMPIHGCGVTNLCLARTSLNSRIGFSKLSINRVSLHKCISKSQGARWFSLDSLAQIPSALFKTVAESDTCAAARNSFIHFHDYTGLPWWCTIVLSSAFLKLCFLPLKIHQMRGYARMELVRKEAESLKLMVIENVRKEKEKCAWSNETANRITKERLEVIKQKLRDKCRYHPAKGIIINYLEMSVWIMMTITWRSMSYGFSNDYRSSIKLVSSFEMEGLFWCLDLTKPDPLYILPCLMVYAYFQVAQLLVIRSKLFSMQQTLFTKLIINFIRIFGLVAGFISAVMPATVSIFWLSGVIFSIIIQIMCMSSRFRQIFKLTYSPVSAQTVLKELFSFKLKFFLETPNSKEVKLMLKPKLISDENVTKEATFI